MARIAVGGFQHETNTFAPQQATWDDFLRADAWPPLLRGPEMIAGVEGFNVPIAGAVKRLAELGHDVVPLAWAAAAPASYVTEDAYEKMWTLFDEDLRKLGPFDAIYLDLHGAMVAENTQDGEGELLRRIRGLVGNELPIVASLDYHANLTPEMASLATALVGYRTYPHIDMAVTGKRAAELLDRLLKEKRPVYLGEFGVYERAPSESRARYLSFVARAADKLGWSWAYWQFDHDFAAFDSARQAWKPDILRALIPPSRWRKSRYDRNTEYCSEVGTATRISEITSLFRWRMRRMLRVGRKSAATTRTETQARQFSHAGR